MWEVKNIDNMKTMYAWHRSYVKGLKSAGPNGNLLPYDSEIKDATSYVESLNQKSYSGFTDWRLPTIDELESLIDANSDYLLIKRPLLKNSYPACWSDTPAMAWNAYGPKVAPNDIKDTAYIPSIKVVDFKLGETGNYSPGDSLWIRCVRNIDD